MARQLIPSAGIDWALRAIGFVQVATLLFVVIFMRPRMNPGEEGRNVEWAALKKPQFTLFTIGMFFVS